MSEAVRWGVLGCAGIATGSVIPAMSEAELTVLSAVASRSIDRAQEVAAQFGVPNAYGSYEELLADPTVEAVYIPLPNGFHAEWSIKAMRAGKHVLCEKPIAVSGTEASEIQAVRDETGCLCLEAFASRFDPPLAKAFEIARSGVLGDLRFIHTTATYLMSSIDPANVRLQADIGGGALYDMGCYAINAQRMLAGREPLAVTTTMAWSERFDVDTAGAAMLDFGAGLLGTIHWGFNAPHGAPFSVVGIEGRLVSAEGWAVPAAGPSLLLTVGDETQEVYVEPADNYVGAVQDLSEAVRGIHAPIYGWEPLDANMRVIDACYASYRSGKAEAVVSGPQMA